MYVLIIRTVIGNEILGPIYPSHMAARLAKIRYEARGIRDIRIAILNEDIIQ